MPKRSSEGIVRTVSAPPMMESAKRPRRTYKSKIKTKIPAGLRSYVKQTVMNMAEAKQIVAGGIVSIDSCQTGQTPTGLNLVPLLSQGTQQNQRVGNDIKIISGVVRGHLSIKARDATKNPAGAPILVKMWLCRYKSANSNSLLQTNIDTRFFEGGSGGAIGFGGTISDMSLFPNVDSWQWLQTKEYKIGVGSNSSAMPEGNVTYFDNSPATVAFEFDFGKYLRGTTQYLDNTLTVATNKNLFLVFQAVYAFPFATTEASELCDLTYATKVQYIDA